MRATYAAPGSIVAILVIAHLFWGDQPGLIRDFAPELATEVLGILITLVFVQLSSIAAPRRTGPRSRLPWRREAI